MWSARSLGYLFAFLLGMAAAVAIQGHAQLSVSVFGASKHSEPGYCEINPGLGFNYQIDKDLRVGHGHFRNSKCHPTNITGVVYCPIKIGALCLGVAFVRLTGYGEKPIYAPLPIGAYTINQHNAIDFFAVTNGELSVAGAAWRYTF